ncbi:MAG: rRNA maturation RNase YbeY [Bacillota bacterium]
MHIEIDDLQSAVEVDENMRAFICQAARQALTGAGFGHGATVDFVLTDDAGIKQLNLQHRGIDVPTDVLSFPLLEYRRPLQPIYSDADSDGSGGLLLGDIAISLERVRRQAQEFGHGFERELGFMVVHGMLHLIGFDHETPMQEQEMFALQERILSGLGLER